MQRNQTASVLTTVIEEQAQQSISYYISWRESSTKNITKDSLESRAITMFWHDARTKSS